MAIEPKKALQSLLDAGNVSRVIYIDDVFAFRNGVEVEQAIGWFSQALAQSPEETLALVTVTYPVPDDSIWRTEFREKWDQFDPNQKAVVVARLSEILNSQLTKDEAIASQLKQLFPANFDYREISPSDWVKQKGEILKNTPENSRIICLFDQDLSADTNFQQIGALSGGGLLKDLVDSYKDSNLLCGILSHTISSIAAEHDYHKTFDTQYQTGVLDPRRYLPLAKSRLNESIKCVDGLKKLLLHSLCETIKQAALQILHESHTSAIASVQSLDIYAFDRMVLKAAHQANEWEIETIVRLFQIYQRNDVRLKLTDPNSVDSLSNLIAKARPTSQIDTVVEEYVYPRVREIRKEELYEKADLIRYRPIETGDIFVSHEDTDKPRRYILLAQPCDLVVRRDGTRTQRLVTLVPIVEKNDKYTTKETRLKWREFWSTLAVIDNFCDDPTQFAVLEFKNAIILKTDVLDLAVLNPGGLCRIDIHNVAIPNHLAEGWKSLLKKWIDSYRQLDMKLQHMKSLLSDSKLSQEIQDELWKAALPEFSFPLILPEIPYDNGVFDFGLRRLERYRQPGADGLLKSYTQFLAREAKEYDFAG